MRTLKCMAAALGLFALGNSGVVDAASWAVGSATGAAGTNVTVPVNFTGDGVTITSQVTVTVAAPLSVVSATGQNGQSCSATGNSVTVVAFSFSALPAGPTNFCDIVIGIAGGAAAGAYPVTPSGQLCSVSGGGAAPTCTATPGTVTVTGGGGNVNPTVTFSPTGGTTITYGAGGTAAPIVLTPSGGSGTGSSTVGPCTITGGGAAFPTTTTNSQTFTGATTTPANITLPACVPQAAVTNATLTCPGTGGAPVSTTFPLVCPAAAVGATPPPLTYNPAAGSTTNVGSGAATVIQVGCPTDGAAATCGGTGTGTGATSTLDQLTATYGGPPFSPTPTMICLFINEAGTALPGTSLDFVAGQLDSGDIRCTCPVAFAPEPFTVTVRERSPQTSAGVIRTFNIVCGAGLVCPTLTAAPSSGTVSLVNGGGNGLVTTYTVSGIQPGATQAINCVQSGATAGSTFTVTTNPSPLVLTSTTTSGTVSASCTNTNLTVATATLTCTPVPSAPGCTPAANTFTLSCPGAAAPPPPVEILPVPAMSEQGRILLAALMLMLGLAVVGFRLRN